MYRVTRSVQKRRELLGFEVFVLCTISLVLHLSCSRKDVVCNVYGGNLPWHLGQERRKRKRNKESANLNVNGAKHGIL